MALIKGARNGGAQVFEGVCVKSLIKKNGFVVKTVAVHGEGVPLFFMSMRRKESLTNSISFKVIKVFDP